MKRLIRATLALLLLASLIPPVSVGAEASGEGARVQSSAGSAASSAMSSAQPMTSVIVGYSGADETKAMRAARGLGGTLKRKAKYGHFSEVAVPKGADVELFVEHLKKKEGVRFAEPNGIVRASTTIPTDPGYSNQWGLRRMNAPIAWDLSLGAGVTVAVIDTGVDFTHPDLIGRVDTLNDWDFVNGDDDARDDDGHGTHVAGIIAASMNNKLGVVGVAPSARVLPLKVLNANGEGDFFTVAQAITYAAQRAQVINMSLGSSDYSSAINSAIQQAVSSDVVVIAASGNDSAGTVTYPARLTNVIGVGSTTSSDLRSSFSNYGTGVDLTAPGSAIYSTVPGGYTWMSGTSMAAPQVAGLAALIRAAHPALAREGVEQLLFSSAKDLGAAGRDDYYGYGRIDAAASLGGLIPRPFSGEVEDVPGRPLSASPIVDSVDHLADRVDVYRVVLEPGRQLEVELTGPAASDLNLYLFGPNTSSVYGRLPLASSASSGSSEALNHLVTANGTYYIAVCAHRDAGAYTLAYTSRWNEEDDDIPGVPLTGASTVGTLTGGANGWDAHDVFGVSLEEGQWVYLAIASSATDFNLRLWGSSAQSVRATSTATLLATSARLGSNESILFRAPTAGTYYVDVHGYSGSGSYALTYGLPTRPSSLSMIASSTIPYGIKGSISGTLTTESGEMTRSAMVSLYQARPGSESWDIVTSAPTDVFGRYKFFVAPTTKTRYKVRFDGDTELLAAASTVSTMLPKAYVSTPIAPSVMYRSRYYTVYGRLKPRHTKGTYPVRIYRWRRVSGGWKSYGYVRAVASNYGTYSKYSDRVRLRVAGRWRLRAVAPADSGHAYSQSSGYDYITVR